MSFYSAVIYKTFQQQFAYRANTLFTIIGSVIQILIQVSIWISLLGVNGNSGPVDLSDMITYTIISLLLRNLVSSSTAYTIADKVKSGAISTDLIKPVNFKTYMLAEQFSQNLFRFIFSCLPVLLISILWFGMKAPASPATFACFLTASALAVILMFYIDYTLGLFVFWVKTGSYIDFITVALFEIFSGAFIPIWFYPEFMVKLSNCLPFRLVAFDPISIYLGKLDIVQSLRVILLQIVWIGLFYLIEKLIWRSVQKLIFVQGG